MSEASPDFYEFGPFQLWPAERELRRGAEVLPLTTKAFDLLLILVRGAGRALTRAELMAALWGDTAVEETNLSQTIFMVRKALGDDSEASAYIVTVPRVGYRFVAQVANGFKEIESPPTRSASERANDSKRRIVGALSVGALAVVAVLIAFNFTGLRDRMVGRRTLPGIRSVAVLPLENLSDDPDQDYLADGMTDGLIASLTKISTLRVVSRTSVMPYRGAKKTAPEIARELNVDAVVTGTVRRARDRVWISAQLVRASPEEHLWAETYDGDSQEVLALQERVARAVLSSLKIKPTARERALLTSRRVDPVAYENYLKGRNMWERPTHEDLLKSRDYYNEALRVDPTYAPIWAGLADTYNRMALNGVLPARDAYPRAKSAAQRALAIDNTLVGPVVALAAAKTSFDWDWPGAEQLFKQALELDADYAEAHEAYAIYLAAVGRTREAVEETRQARDLDPITGLYTNNLIWRLLCDHRYEEADVEHRRLLQVSSFFKSGPITASLYLQKGRTKEALTIFREEVPGPNPPLLLMFLGRALGLTGNLDEGRKVLERMLSMEQQGYVQPDLIASAYEGLGERDKALEWYEKAYEERSVNLWLLPDPQLDSIRSDPRFKRILRGMGFAQ